MTASLNVFLWTYACFHIGELVFSLEFGLKVHRNIAATIGMQLRYAAGGFCLFWVCCCEEGKIRV
jgi:hypothetical protein